MNELIEKVEQVKNDLDNLDEVKEVKQLIHEIMKDKELLKNIEEYNNTQDDKIKEKILNHKLWREYKHKETECNFIILEINQRLKELSNKGKCEK